MQGLNLTLTPANVGLIRKVDEWSPASLFSDGKNGVWYDPSDASMLFIERNNPTTPAGVGDPVGTMLDKSGNNKHASSPNDAARAKLQKTDLAVLDVDGVDDAYDASTSLSLGDNQPLYTAFRYRALTGNDSFRSAFSMGSGVESFHLGLDASNSAANARMRLSEQFIVDTVDERIADGGAHTIEFAVTASGLLRLWIDGDLVNENNDNKSRIAGERFDDLQIRLFDRSAMEFISFIVVQADLSDFERENIRYYLRENDD